MIKVSFYNVNHYKTIKEMNTYNMDVQFFSVEGYHILHKTVTKGETSGRIYLPKDWIGKKVVVILKELI